MICNMAFPDHVSDFIWDFRKLPFPLHLGKYFFYKIGKINDKQEMSQSRDECPQRNWSSIRHIRGKLAVIL